MTAIKALLQHIETVRYADLPPQTIAAAKTFIFDSIAVGISGSRVPTVNQVKQAASSWGDAKQAQVWATGEWLPAGNAALVNGFQIHNQEWDAVHEKAVVHPMATILSALTSYAQQHNLSGEQLILGVVVAVDVATCIGSAVTSGLKFFRPSMCGALGVTAGICAMQQIKGDVLANAMGISYSQLSGTMQAHVEGSGMLAMQIGINARSAMHAVDLAQAGFSGPKDILEGPFGYFKLFEDTHDIDLFYQRLGKQFQIERVSHKPFPTGRAGHGCIDGLLTLQQQHGFSSEQIQHIHVLAPPLIMRLVGRPLKADMDSSYAKLCQGYIAAIALKKGNVGVEDFSAQALTNPDTLALAAKVSMQLNDCQDPNALAPVRVEVSLTDGRFLHIDLPAVLGHPDRPLSKEQQVKKFWAACRSAIYPFSDDAISKLINAIDGLEQISNINNLVQLMIYTESRGIL